MKLRQKIAGGVALVGASVGSAMAAVDPAVTTALSDGKADTGTVAGAALLIVIGLAVWRYMKRAA